MLWSVVMAGGVLADRIVVGADWIIILTTSAGRSQRWLRWKWVARLKERYWNRVVNSFVIAVLGSQNRLWWGRHHWTLQRNLLNWIIWHLANFLQFWAWRHRCSWSFIFNGDLLVADNWWCVWILWFAWCALLWLGGVGVSSRTSLSLRLWLAT